MSLIKLAYQQFVKKHQKEVFSSFQCPQNVDLLLFFQLCVYYSTDIRPPVVNQVIEGDCIYTESIATNLDREVVYKKHQNFNNLQDGPVSSVQIGMDKEPICIHGNAVLTVPGNTSRVDKGQLYIVEQSSASQFTT